MSELVSRILFYVIIYLGWQLLAISSDLPWSVWKGSQLLYLIFLQVGFASPEFVTKLCGSLLHYLFTLTINIICLLMAVIFCGTFRCLATPGNYPAPFPLGVRTFLLLKTSDHSTHSKL